MKAQIEKKLDAYGYNYQITGDEINVHLSSDQQVSIHCKGTDTCLVKYQLTGWNFLTGLLSMSLKGAVVYYSVGTAVIAVLFALLGSSFPNTDLSLFLIAAVGWFASWTAYYSVTFESFKRQVMNWADQI